MEEWNTFRGISQSIFFFIFPSLLSPTFSAKSSGIECTPFPFCWVVAATSPFASDVLRVLFTAPSPLDTRAPLNRTFGDGERVIARRDEGIIGDEVCIRGCE